MRTGQWENVAPNFGSDATKYVASGDFQKKFDAVFDPGALYVAYQCLLVTHDGAQSWTAASPELTTAKGAPQVACGTPKPKVAATAAGAAPPPPPPPAPTITDFSISGVKRGVVWTVSSNGQIFNTMDHGKVWNNVSNVADLPEHLLFNTIAAGDDANTAYVSGRIGAARGATLPAGVDADLPFVWRTTDGGKSWVAIVNGLPRDERTGSWVNSLRVDPEQPGLLFAGTETTVYVSFDNGDHWQSLQQNLRSTSIRDLDVHTDHHQNDLVIGTYGRGFWVLDDITPLRQIAANAAEVSTGPVYFFKPENAIRARINSNWDQPFSIEVPHVPNVPYGAIVDYYLDHQPEKPILLQVYDADGRLVRTMSSVLPPPIDDADYPHYWVASPESRALSTHIGLNRINWNLNYEDPPALRHDLENQMNMVPGSATPGPHGPQVIPGVYTLKLTVDGKVSTREVTVVNDPRVGQSVALMAALRTQNKLSQLSVEGMEQSFEGHDEVDAVKRQLQTLMQGSLPAEVGVAAKKLDASLTGIGGVVPAGGGGEARRGPPDPDAMKSFFELNNLYNGLVSMIQVGLDMAPTSTQIATWKSDCTNYNRTRTAWDGMARQIANFNAVLAKNNLQTLELAPSKLTAATCTFGPDARKKSSR